MKTMTGAKMPMSEINSKVSVPAGKGSLGNTPDLPTNKPSGKANPSAIKGFGSGSTKGLGSVECNPVKRNGTKVSTGFSGGVIAGKV